MYSTFNCHKSRVHQTSLASDFGSDIVFEQTPQATSSVTIDGDEESTSTEVQDKQCDTLNLKNQLKLNAASLFMKMQAILHVSTTATQEIVDHLNQIYSLSQPLIKDAIDDVLQRHSHNIPDAILNEDVSAVMDSNVIFSATSKGAESST